MNKFLSTWTASNYSSTPTKTSMRSLFSSLSPVRAVTEKFIDLTLLNSEQFRVSRYPVYYNSSSLRSHSSIRTRRCHKSALQRMSHDRPEVPAFRPEESRKFKRIQAIGIKCMFCKRYDCRCDGDKDDFLDMSNSRLKERKYKITKVVNQFQKEKSLDRTLSNASRESARKFKAKSEMSSMVKDLIIKLDKAKNARIKEKIRNRK